MLTKTQINKLRKAMSQDTGSDIKIYNITKGNRAL